MSDEVATIVGFAIVIGVVVICFLFYYFVYKTVNCLLKRDGEFNCLLSKTFCDNIGGCWYRK